MRSLGSWLRPRRCIATPLLDDLHWMCLPFPQVGRNHGVVEDRRERIGKVDCTCRRLRLARVVGFHLAVAFGNKLPNLFRLLCEESLVLRAPVFGRLIAAPRGGWIRRLRLGLDIWFQGWIGDLGGHLRLLTWFFGFLCRETSQAIPGPTVLSSVFGHILRVCTRRTVVSSLHRLANGLPLRLWRRLQVGVGDVRRRRAWFVGHIGSPCRDRANRHGLSANRVDRKRRSRAFRDSVHPTTSHRGRRSGSRRVSIRDTLGVGKFALFANCRGSIVPFSTSFPSERT